MWQLGVGEELVFSRSVADIQRSLWQTRSDIFIEMIFLDHKSVLMVFFPVITVGTLRTEEMNPPGRKVLWGLPLPEVAASWQQL